MSSLRTSRRSAVLVVAVAVSLSALPLRPARAEAPPWLRPVGDPVVRPFDEPQGRFAAGHRGVDFVAAPGTPVRAANDGQVTFVGTVAGSLHVVVAHAGGLRTSYSYLLRVDVQMGQRIGREQVLGAAGGSGDAHGPGVLHFGVRLGDRYIDPMLLLAPTDLTKLVRLISPDGPTISDEVALRREMKAAIDATPDDDCAGGIPFVEQICDAGEAVGGATVTAAEATADAAAWVAKGAVDVGLAALRAAGAAAAAVADQIEGAVRAVARTVEAAARGIAGAAEAATAALASAAGAVFTAVIRAGQYLLEHLTSCPQPPPAKHPKGSGNVAIAVGGLGTSQHRRREPDGTTSLDPSFDFKPGRLGYDAGDVAYFSYAAGSATYEPTDTYGDLHQKARLLANHVRAWGAQNPGRSIDLIGHSQGGVVIDLFLMEIYAKHPSEFPKVENVVTYASPHEGTPTASFGNEANRQIPIDVIAEALGRDVPLGTTALAQLDERSSTIHDLWSQGEIPSGIRFLSLAGFADVVVPSSSADVPGGNKVVLPVGNPFNPVDDHSGILVDDDAISAAQTHLSGGRPADTCGIFTDVGGELYSDVVRIGTAGIAASPAPLGVPFDAPDPRDGR